MLRSTKERARGNWRNILVSLGVPSPILNGKHQPCPFCGGKDRFRFTDYQGSGGFICNQCGNGNGFDFLMKLRGYDFKTAATEVDGVIGSCAPAQKRGRSEDEKRRAMQRVWDLGRPVTATDVAGRYLRGRCGVVEFSSHLRFVPRLRCASEDAEFPALIAKVTTSDGRPTNIHRTYLSNQGGKAALEEPRRLMPGPIEKGSAVRLIMPGANVLGIAEGIETALSAAALFNVPCWAALNAQLLKSWVPPAGITDVVIFADNDESFTGHEAGYALARRLSSEGLRAVVRMPEQTGWDWNDVHREQLVAAAEIQFPVLDNLHSLSDACQGLINGDCH
jgi:putative DNA primase/helicase